jgi:hypothetical protein
MEWVRRFFHCRKSFSGKAEGQSLPSSMGTLTNSSTFVKSHVAPEQGLEPRSANPSK